VCVCAGVWLRGQLAVASVHSQQSKEMTGTVLFVGVRVGELNEELNSQFIFTTTTPCLARMRAAPHPPAESTAMASIFAVWPSNSL
jgi:hypothetical protein